MVAENLHTYTYFYCCGWRSSTWTLTPKWPAKHSCLSAGLPSNRSECFIRFRVKNEEIGNIRILAKGWLGGRVFSCGKTCANRGRCEEEEAKQRKKNTTTGLNCLEALIRLDLGGHAPFRERKRRRRRFTSLNRLFRAWSVGAGMDYRQIMGPRSCQEVWYFHGILCVDLLFCHFRVSTQWRKCGCTNAPG